VFFGSPDAALRNPGDRSQDTAVFRILLHSIQACWLFRCMYVAYKFSLSCINNKAIENIKHSAKFYFPATTMLALQELVIIFIQIAQ
jgi:hypothetical protein